MSDEEYIAMKSAEEAGPQSKKKVFVVTIAHAIAILILVVILIILVGVLSGVLSAKHAAKKAREEALAEKERGDDSSTEKPSDIAPTEKTGPEPWYQVRLPDSIIPIHYDLYLQPYLSQNTFKGTVSILFAVTKKAHYANYVLIHINEMEIRNASVSKQGTSGSADSAIAGDELNLRRTFEYEKNNYFVFELEEDLEIGKYVIRMDYNASLSRQLNGFYNSTYTNAKGEIH